MVHLWLSIFLSIDAYLGKQWGLKGCRGVTDSLDFFFARLSTGQNLLVFEISFQLFGIVVHAQITFDSIKFLSYIAGKQNNDNSCD